jgi:hypothetical protein
MNRSWIPFVIGILGFCIASIAQESSDKKEKTQTQTQTQTQIEAIVTYELIQQGTYSGLKEPAAKVVQSREEWQSIWKQHVSMLVPQPLLPEIDFNTIAVVVLTAGEKKTSGYSVLLKDISAEANDVVIKYRLVEPPANSFTLQVLTQPFLMFKVMKPGGTIRLVKE